MAERVLVAMSGGVDSSVAAARLLADGYDVVGVTLHLWDYPDDGGVRGRCCAPEDVHDARRVADLLGFAHYAFDRREMFRHGVVEPFVDSYLRGETPSPCVDCNRGIKIPELIKLCERLDARTLATGHYARIDIRNGRHRLMRARDRAKDQSYFLHMLGPDALARLRFPLGDCEKGEVREQALRLGLPGANKGESQELCFVPNGRYDSFVREQAAARVRPGPVVDEAGRVVGKHAGVHGFTIGQRRNLGIALGRRAYVVGLDAQQGVVRLGPRQQLLAFGALVADATINDDVSLPATVAVQVRYRGQPTLAQLSGRQDGLLEAVFQEPIAAVVPGQYAVFYQQERVIGGGLIRSPLPVQRAEGLA